MKRQEWLIHSSFFEREMARCWCGSLTVIGMPDFARRVYFVWKKALILSTAVFTSWHYTNQGSNLYSESMQNFAVLIGNDALLLCDPPHLPYPPSFSLPLSSWCAVLAGCSRGPGLDERAGAVHDGWWAWQGRLAPCLPCLPYFSLYSMRTVSYCPSNAHSCEVNHWMTSTYEWPYPNSTILVAGLGS